MRGRIENSEVELYVSSLREPYRPPSRGGNTRALHAHYLTIGGETYSFLALGTKKWVFKHDRVSFEYEVKGPYRNILKDTLSTLDAKGREVQRGERDFKPMLRTAETRLPVSRREARG